MIGPWDHNQCYGGGDLHRAAYDLEDPLGIDVVERRLAFFDQHLKQQGHGPALPGRVSVFITGANRWRSFETFPPPGVSQETLHLHSGGRANSSSGDGRLLRVAPRADAPPDHFEDDPAWPFVAAMASAKGAGHALDLRERERNHDTLVYCTGPLAEPLTLLGEAMAELHVSADAPDADVVVWLAEHRADGSTVWLAFGQLRLRYHQGFDAERLLQPGQTVLAHDAARPSRLALPVLRADDRPGVSAQAGDGGRQIATGRPARSDDRLDPARTVATEAARRAGRPRQRTFACMDDPRAGTRPAPDIGE